MGVAIGLVPWLVSGRLKVSLTWSGSEVIGLVTLGGVLLTAIGTLALALSTRRLAASTAQQAKYTSDSVELQGRELQSVETQLGLTQDQLKLTVQPLLTSVPSQVYLSGNQLYKVEFIDGLVEPLHDLGDIVVPRHPDWGAFCSVPLRNVGSGVAFLRSNSISDGTGRYSWNGKFSNAVVPVGELTRLTFTVPLDRPELTELRNGLLNGQPPPEVDVGYTDLNGRPFRTKLFLRWTGAVWYVRQVYLYRDGEEEPFATTGPSDP